jgi:hypothetical protein
LKTSNAATTRFLAAATALLIGSTHFANASAQASDAPADVKNVLYANDKLLLTAIHRGDRSTWARLTTYDFMYVEEGDVARRDKFLRELKDDGLMPLIIRNYEVKIIGDTAQVFHQDDVPQRPGDIDVSKAHLLMTETWQRIHGEWLLRIVHTDRVRVNPSPITLSSNQIDELVGTYRNAGGTYAIRREGDRILGGKPGRPFVLLKAETRDVLFEPDNVYKRDVFQRDANGRVTGFVMRNENTDRPWIRIGA